MKRITSFLLIFFSFIFLSLYKPYSTSAYGPANNCLSLPPIPTSVTPTTGDQTTQFKVTLNWSQISDENFNKYKFTDVYIYAFDSNEKAISTTENRDYYDGRKKLDKTYILTNFHKEGKFTATINLGIDEARNCINYETTPLEISVTSTLTQPTATPTPIVCAKKEASCSYGNDNECRNGTSQCENYVCVQYGDTDRGYCVNTATPTPIPPTPTGLLTIGKVCKPDQQNVITEFTCGNNTKCERVGDQYLCIYNVAPELQANCNTSLEISKLTPCDLSVYKPPTKATICGITKKGFSCKSDEYLCINGVVSEENVFCEKPRPVAQPCLQWTDLKGNRIPPPDLDNKDNTDIKCAQVDSAIGEIDTDPVLFIKKLFGIILSLAGGIALLLIIVSGYNFIASQGNPEKIQGARETLTSAIIGLLFIIFSLVILQVVGVDILKIPGLR